MTVSPRYQHFCDRCTCLGQATINDETADLFVCDDLVVARFGDEPGQAEAEHMYSLSLESNAFLLAAHRLYLDSVGKEAIAGRVPPPGEAIQS